MPHPEWLIRKAGVADATAIAKVHVDTWRSSYRGVVPDSILDGLSYGDREARWRERLSGRSRGFLVAEDDAGDAGDVVGFAWSGPQRSGVPEYAGEIYALYVLPDRQRQGVGRLLTAAVAGELVERGMRSMLVWALADNPYRRFYELLGGWLLDKQALYSSNGVELPEVVYGWADLGVLVGSLNRRPDAPPWG